MSLLIRHRQVNLFLTDRTELRTGLREHVCQNRTAKIPKASRTGLRGDSWGRTERREQPERTSRKGQLKQEFQCRQNGTVRTGQAEQNRQDMTPGTELPGEDFQGRTTKAELPRQDYRKRRPGQNRGWTARNESHNRTARTGQPERDSQNGSAGVCSTDLHGSILQSTA